MRKIRLVGLKNSMSKKTAAKPARKEEPYDPFKNLHLEPSAKQILLKMYYASTNTIMLQDNQQRLGTPSSQALEDLATNLKNPLVSLFPDVFALVLSHLSLQDASRVSQSCFTLWNRHRTHRHVLLAKLAQEARKDPMLRYLLDAILFDPTFRTYPINFVHIYHVLNHARPILDTIFKSDPYSAWKFFTLCCSQPIVDQLLRDNMPTTLDYHNRGVMHYISLAGDVDYFEWFFSGFDSPFIPSIMDPESRLAKLAALGGSIPSLEYLETERGYDLRTVFEGETPATNESLLTFTVIGGHKKAVSFLLGIGIDPFIGQNIRLVAAKHGHWQLYDALPEMVRDAQHGLEILDPSEDPYDSQLLAKSAVRHGNLKLFLTLIQKHQLKPEQFIDDVITGGHHDIFWHFINQNWLSLSATFEGGVTLAHLLAQAGHLELLQAVLNKNDKQANPSNIGESILHFAASTGQREIFDYLYHRYFLGKPLPVDQLGNTVAHVAAKTGHAFFLRYLATISPSVLTQSNYQGKTILHEAAHYGDPQLLKMIIQEFKIKVDSKDSRGNTVLHILASIAIEKPQYWKSVAELIKTYGTDLLDIPNKGPPAFTVREKILQSHAESYFPEEMLMDESKLTYK